ncbi:MAG: hypothetical protein IPJ32_14705 [Sphingobacteriaceae bacterium]|nr:hypothetical protein [Sphingobacteriaceae bacterium]
MKNTVLKLAALSVLILHLACGEKKPATVKSTETSIILEGYYNGNNLFVKNPVSTDGFGYCVNEILINGNRTSDEINSETIELDLKASGVREGKEIRIEIKHYKGCEPVVLNPKVLD